MVSSIFCAVAGDISEFLHLSCNSEHFLMGGGMIHGSWDQNTIMFAQKATAMEIAHSRLKVRSSTQAGAMRFLNGFGRFGL